MIQIPVIIAMGIVAAVACAAVSVTMEKIKTISQTEGYERASEEFEKKYRRQYDDFMNAKKTWEKDRDEYEELIKAYKEYAEELRRENEELKRNGRNSMLASLAVQTGNTISSYSAGLAKTASYYEDCLDNLLMLKEG